MIERWGRDRSSKNNFRGKTQSSRAAARIIYLMPPSWVLSQIELLVTYTNDTIIIQLSLPDTKSLTNRLSVTCSDISFIIWNTRAMLQEQLCNYWRNYWISVQWNSGNNYNYIHPNIIIWNMNNVRLNVWMFECRVGAFLPRILQLFFEKLRRQFFYSFKICVHWSNNNISLFHDEWSYRFIFH